MQSGLVEILILSTFPSLTYVYASSNNSFCKFSLIAVKLPPKNAISINASESVSYTHLHIHI